MCAQCVRCCQSLTVLPALLLVDSSRTRCRSPYLHIVYSNLLIETRQQMQVGCRDKQAGDLGCVLSQAFGAVLTLTCN